MISLLSVGVLVHIAGMITVLLLISNTFHLDFNHSNNETGIFHKVFNEFAAALSGFLPVGGDLFGLDIYTLLQALLYLVAALYVFYLSRLDINARHIFMCSS